MLKHINIIVFISFETFHFELFNQIPFLIRLSNFPLIVVGLILVMKFIVSMLVLYLNFLRNIFTTKLTCIGSQIYGKRDKYLNAIGKDSSLINKILIHILGRITKTGAWDIKRLFSGHNSTTFLLNTLRLQFYCGFSQRL